MIYLIWTERSSITSMQWKEEDLSDVLQKETTYQEWIDAALFHNLAPAVIFDLDGTLANLNGRKPYGDAQGECEQDLLREDVYEEYMKWAEAGFWMILVSGRFERFTPQTERWL